MAKEFGIQVSDRHINRLLQKLGLSNRHKRYHTTEKVAKFTQIKDSGITICDLQSSTAPASLWSFNLITTRS